MKWFAPILLLAASASHAQFLDWNVGLGGNSMRYAQSREVGPLTPTRLWTGGLSAVISQQPMIDGQIVFTSRIFNINNVQGGTDIVAQDLETGRILWQVQLPIDFPATDWRSRLTAVRRGVVYATRSGNTNRSHLYALRATDGSVIWRSAALTDETTSEGMAFGADGDLVTSGGRGLIRIDAETGATVWDVARTYPSSDSGAVAINAERNRVYAWEQTSQGPRVSAYDFATGARLYSTAGLGGLVQQITLFLGPDGTVYAPRAQNNPNTDFLVAYEDTGSSFAEKWRYPLGYAPFAGHAVGPDGSVYAYSRQSPRTIVRLNPANGTVQNESAPIPADFFSGRLAVDATGTVYFTNGGFSNGAVYSFNADLTQRWTEALTNVNQGGPALGSDGTLIVAGTGAQVRAYRDPFTQVDPFQFAVTRGQLVSGDLASLLRSDDQRLIVQQRPPFLVSDPSAQVVIDGLLEGGAPNVLRFRLEAQCTGVPSSRVIQRIELFDFAANRWQVADERSPSLQDSGVSVAAVPVAAFVGASGEVRARVSWFDRGVLAPAWEARIDVAVFRTTRL